MSVQVVPVMSMSVVPEFTGDVMFMNTFPECTGGSNDVYKSYT